MYDSLKGFTCRVGTLDDLDKIYILVEPFVVDSELEQTQKEREQRILYKYTKFSLKNSTCVVCENVEGEMVAVATGTANNVVATLVSVGGIYCTTLLYKVVFCDLHNRFIDSTFELDKNGLKAVYDKIHTATGKACEIKDSKGVLTVEAKNSILSLYSSMKGTK